MINYRQQHQQQQQQQQQQAREETVEPTVGKRTLKSAVVCEVARSDEPACLENEIVRSV